MKYQHPEALVIVTPADREKEKKAEMVALKEAHKTALAQREELFSVALHTVVKEFILTGLLIGLGAAYYFMSKDSFDPNGLTLPAAGALATNLYYGLKLNIIRNRYNGTVSEINRIENNPLYKESATIDDKVKTG